MTTLNFSDQPVRRGQYQPGPTVVAEGGDVTALADRVTDLETAVAELQSAMTLLLSDVSTLQTTAADHEARISALEP